jgi:hypothetical protein
MSALVMLSDKGVDYLILGSALVLKSIPPDYITVKSALNLSAISRIPSIQPVL